MNHADVAVVLATDRYTAQDALEFIEVDYEPLPAVVDVEVALAEDAPLVHEELGPNHCYTWTLGTGDVDGQLHGGIAQALYEEVVYDEDANLTTGTMVDYLVPGAPEVPNFTRDRTEVPSPTNHMGVKGIGESGAIAAQPAVIDALSHEGVTHIDMPASPLKVGTAGGTRPGVRYARRRPLGSSAPFRRGWPHVAFNPFSRRVSTPVAKHPGTRRVMGRRSNIGRKDRNEGLVDKAKGRIKEASGALTGDKVKKSEGRADQRKGTMKEKKGHLKDLLK